MRFGVVVPVKPVSVAKSRLAPLGESSRRDLVAAFAADTVAAALACPAVGAVLVVTDDAWLAFGLRPLGVEVIPDGQAGDLNASLHQGAAELLRVRPDLRPVALCGDLPSLRSADLETVLGRVPTDRSAFVADAAGVGTTLFTAPSLAEFVPQFGEDSRDAHLAVGAVELAVEALSTVRRDVDTPRDLQAALELGVGPRTSLVVTLNGLQLTSLD